MFRNTFRLISFQMSMSTFKMRYHILVGYLCWRLQCTAEELAEVVKKYPSVDKRSLLFLKQTIDILVEEFKFSTTKIMRNGFLLLCHPGHLDAILSQVKRLGGMDTRRIGALCPRLLTVVPEQLLRIESVLQEHGVTEAQIQRCPGIYTLCPRTVDARLKELQQVSEFAVRKSMPRMLNLVYHCSKAAQRIEILAEKNHTPISAPITINTLTAATHNFDKVLYSGGDMRCGREAHAFLAHHLDKDETEVRSRLRKHPAAYRAALLNVRKAVDLLEANGFTREQIWEGLQVVLYDVEHLAHQLQLLPTREELQPFEMWRSEPCLAEVLLYFIERDTHFTGLAKMDVPQTSSSGMSASQQKIFDNLYLHTKVCRKDTVRESKQRTNVSC
ncbi:transcription termination factor 5, mitochondrial-like isoform X2 [Ornithodoros turicata]|uniref:transcription termination factor 5, mitochondrial-like isoform X2 n=1 Tax=Ornithodoros turicata TaxID=34597 RepID=UPI003138B3DB